jgi:drug/metabolite transporter (DMT)-like permease
MYSNTAGMISYVMVTMNNFSWMMDDLSFTPAASATPLPAALPLFATGFGAMGLFGWRRKRKGAAVAA